MRDTNVFLIFLLSIEGLGIYELLTLNKSIKIKEKV